MSKQLLQALPRPHGGVLRELMASAERQEELRQEIMDLPSWQLGTRQLWDLELLLNGAFSPLAGFMGRADYERVCRDMRLDDGTVWPMPITLDVPRSFLEEAHVSQGARIVLRHPEGMALAVLNVSDIWSPDLKSEAEAVFGTTDATHPGVFHLLHDSHDVYIGGTIEGLELPRHHTFDEHRLAPQQQREWFASKGWRRVVAFQTRNPMHRAHVELTRQAAKQVDAKLLLQPVVGRTSPGDIDYFTRVRCYQAVLKTFDPDAAALNLLPLAMRMGGPREALWHAIIRKNYGCSHFIVGRDHAGPRDRNGKPFYGPYDAQELVKRFEDEVGIELVTFENMVYVQDQDEYVPESQVDGQKVLSLSGTELRRRLRSGQDIPSWFTYPDVVKQLRKQYPPRQQQGVTVFFTGLSGAGKSTIANILAAKLMEEGSRPVSLLDGDIVRTHLSSELGFSKEHRDLNILRIGYVASEITKNRGVAVCAPIAPYVATRKKVREMIEAVGGFVLVHVDTPLDVCEERDRKGLYAKARAGLIKEFTGIDDPYEAPADADIRIDTSQLRPEESAERVMQVLIEEGYLPAQTPDSPHTDGDDRTEADERIAAKQAAKEAMRR